MSAIVLPDLGISIGVGLNSLKSEARLRGLPFLATALHLHPAVGGPRRYMKRAPTFTTRWQWRRMQDSAARDHYRLVAGLVVIGLALAPQPFIYFAF